MPAHFAGFSGTDVSIKSGGVKLVVWPNPPFLNELIWSCKCFSHVSKIPISTYIWWNTNLHIYLVEYQSPHISGGIPISTYIRWNTNLHIYPVEYQSPHISGGIPISTYIRWNTNLHIYPVEYQSPHISGGIPISTYIRLNSVVLKKSEFLNLEMY